MFRQFLNSDLQKAFFSGVFFYLGMWLLAYLKTHSNMNYLTLELTYLIVLGFLFLLNLVMVNGFTSLDNYSTRLFYSFVLPFIVVWPLFVPIIRSEGYFFFIACFVHFICSFVLNRCLVNMIFRRSVQTVSVVVLVFCSPMLYLTIW